MRKAYSYKRFSSTRQADGDSLSRQKDKTDIIAKMYGLTVAREFSDKGRSAFKGGQQKELAEFTALARQKIVKAGEVLILENLDRYSRETALVAASNIQELFSLGIAVATLDRLYEPPASDADVMMIVMTFIRSNGESKRKSEFSTRNQAKHREEMRKGQKVSNRCPAWITPTTDDKKPFRIEPQKKKTIQRIFELCIQGYGSRSIAEILNKEKIPSVAAGSKVNAGKQWSDSYVASILLNRQTFGEHQPCRVVSTKTNKAKRTPDGDPIPNYYPAAVTRETFYRAANASGGRKTTHGRRGENVANIWQGILFDARTGSRMQLAGMSSAEKHKGIGRRIACRVRGADWYSFRLEHFEKAVFNILSGFDPKDLFPSEAAAPTDEIEARIGELAEKIVQIKAKIKKQSDIGHLLELLSEFTEEKKNTEMELEKVRAMNSTPASTNLKEAKTLWTLQAEAKHKTDFRMRLQSAVRRLLSSVWVLLDDYQIDGKSSRVCFVQLHLQNGFRLNIGIFTKQVGFGPNKSLEVKQTWFTGGFADLREWRNNQVSLLAGQKRLPKRCTKKKAKSG